MQLLQLDEEPTQQFLFDGSMRVAFFGLHLNSTDGDTVFALDFNRPWLVRLSPNWALPIPLPGQAAFLAWVGNRYVPIPGTKKTANCSYIERWDAALNHVRYARGGTAAICYGASLYRPDLTPSVIIIRKTSD
jgi:hypothetical protein